MRHPYCVPSAYRFWIAPGVILLSACAEAPPVVGPEAPRAVAISISPDSANLVFLGETATFTATITDQYGAALADTVTWVTDAPEVFGVSSNGVVTALANGDGTVSASYEALSANATVTVNQTPTKVEVVSGEDQEALPGSTLPNPFVVRVLDRGAAPIAAITVFFSPADGHGSTDPSSIETDETGEAATKWTLGSKVGPQLMTVSVPDGPRVRATASGTMGSAIEIVSGDRQRALPGNALPEPVVVRVLDRDGDPFPGTTVLFTPETTAGTAAPDSVVTDGAGEAPTIWTLGDSVGPQVVTASVPSGPTMQIMATGLTGVGICDRTLQVQWAIMQATDRRDCADVTAHQLNRITHLGWYSGSYLSGISQLYDDDLSGLTSLETLSFRYNDFTTLPTRIFADLRSLRLLSLNQNAHLSELPSDLLAGLSTLAYVSVRGTDLETLPDGLFSDLPNLTTLDVSSNKLQTLPTAIFSGLYSLDTLKIHNNPIRELPEGIFGDLSNLRSLNAIARYDSTAVDHSMQIADTLVAPLAFPINLAEYGEQRGIRPNIGLPLQTTTPTPIASLRRAPLFAEELPPHLLSGLTSLETLSLGGWFTSVPAGAFVGLSSLRSLTLTGPINSIEDGAFAGLAGLQSLSLSGHLQLLPAQALADLTTLETLLLGLPLAMVNGNDFANLSTLQSLFIRNSEMDQLPAHVFSELRQLRFLQLRSNNRLATIHRDALAGLSNMDYIQLFSNAITSLPQGVFADLQNMRYLWLDGNLLTSVPDGVLSKLSSLEQLALGEHIANVSPNAFEGLPKLDVLWLYSTRLSDLPPGVFSGLGNLRFLWLERYDGFAPIDFPEDFFSGLTKLRSIRIYGHVGEIPPGLFGGLSDLYELYLLYNRIVELPVGTFVGLANLERLTLCHNPGADFPLLLELQRSDTTDLSAPSPATVEVQLAVGAPFDIDVEISAPGATLSSATATITKGTATSDGIVVTRNENHSGAVWVSLSKVSRTPVESCYYLTHPSLDNPYVGLDVVLGDSIALFK